MLVVLVGLTRPAVEWRSRVDTLKRTSLLESAGAERVRKDQTV